MFIYVIVNSESLKIYIGQHKGANLRKYLQDKFAHAKYFKDRPSRLFASIRKHPKEVWSIHPLISDLQTREECNHWEKLLIKALNAQHPDVGYNIRRGGEGFAGAHSEETRQKMSRRRRKLFRTPERRQIAKERFKKMWADPKKKQEIREAMLAAQPRMRELGHGFYKFTAEERIENARNGGLGNIGGNETSFQSGHSRGAGIPLSAEHRHKLSVAARKRKNPSKIKLHQRIIQHTDQILAWHNEGKSLRWIAKRLKVSTQPITDVIHGKPYRSKRQIPNETQAA